MYRDKALEKLAQSVTGYQQMTTPEAMNGNRELIKQVGSYAKNKALPNAWTGAVNMLTPAINDTLKIPGQLTHAAVGGTELLAPYIARAGFPFAHIPIALSQLAGTTSGDMSWHPIANQAKHVVDNLGPVQLSKLINYYRRNQNLDYLLRNDIDPNDMSQQERMGVNGLHLARLSSPGLFFGMLGKGFGLAKKIPAVGKLVSKAPAKATEMAQTTAKKMRHHDPLSLALDLGLGALTAKDVHGIMTGEGDTVKDWNQRLQDDYNIYREYGVRPTDRADEDTMPTYMFNDDDQLKSDDELLGRDYPMDEAWTE